MEIEGLVARRMSGRAGMGTQASFIPQGMRGYRHIRLKVSPKGDAVAELIEGRSRPGISAGEMVPIMSYSDDLGDRVVRAMAMLHFGIDEAANGYTATDMEMISRGFIVGRTPEKLPIWIAEGDGHFVTVGKKAEGGLPSVPNDPVTLVFGIPGGNKVTVFAETLPSALQMLDTGNLPALLSQTGNVEVKAALYTEHVTFH